MARYTGPKTKISRIFGEPITGNGKWLTKNSNPPGMHGANRKRKTLGEYALQLREKQKAKYTYGLLEKQFRKTYSPKVLRLRLAPCIPGGLLFLVNHFPLPVMGSPKILEIFVLGPV